MFKDRGNPTDVAIALNLRQKEVSEYYKEYKDPSGPHILNQIYEENGNDIRSILELYKQMKVTGLNAVHIVRLLSISNNDIPLVEY